MHTVLIILVGEGVVLLRQRLWFCLLLIGMMLYYAVPRLNFAGTMEERIFAGAWLFLAFCTVGGNVAEVLFQPKKKHVQKVNKRYPNRKRMYNS